MTPWDKASMDRAWAAHVAEGSPGLVVVAGTAWEMKLYRDALRWPPGVKFLVAGSADIVGRFVGPVMYVGSLARTMRWIWDTLEPREHPDPPITHYAIEDL